MLTLTMTTWSEGRGPSECGIQIDGTRFSFEDLDEITRGGPMIPAADLQEFSQRLRVRQSLIGSAIAKLMRDTNSQPEPRSSLTPTGVISYRRKRMYTYIKILCIHINMWSNECVGNRDPRGRSAKDKQMPRIQRVDVGESDWDMWRIGPVIIVQAYSQKLYATMQVCYNQADQATCAITKWEIDGLVTVLQNAGTNSDWRTFWSAFLKFLPVELATEVALHEAEVRH